MRDAKRDGVKSQRDEDVYLRYLPHRKPLHGLQTAAPSPSSYGPLLQVQDTCQAFLLRHSHPRLKVAGGLYLLVLGMRLPGIRNKHKTQQNEWTETAMVLVVT